MRAFRNAVRVGRDRRCVRRGPIWLGLCCLVLAGCGGAVHQADPPPSDGPLQPVAAPAPPATCGLADLPAGFTPDATHSGSIQPSDYTESGDLQAAMLYDSYLEGARSVYTHLHAPAGGDLVIQCIDLEFQNAAGASHFAGSFAMLRQDEAPAVKSQPRPPVIGSVQTIGYIETAQSFSEYGIASTTVLELSAQVGARFYTASVAGPAPSASVAVQLLRDMGV
jgi:hypothetical protein